jgi:hypothetical protein
MLPHRFIRPPGGAFSTVEFIVALLIGALLMVAAYRFLVGKLTQTKATAAATRELQDTIRTQHLLMDDVTMAGFNPRGATGVSPVTATDYHNLAIQGDFNINGYIDTDPAEKERVFYHFETETNQLTRAYTQETDQPTALLTGVKRLCIMVAREQIESDGDQKYFVLNTGICKDLAIERCSCLEDTGEGGVDSSLLPEIAKVRIDWILVAEEGKNPKPNSLLVRLENTP